MFARRGKARLGCAGFTGCCFAVGFMQALRRRQAAALKSSLKADRILWTWLEGTKIEQIRSHLGMEMLRFRRLSSASGNCTCLTCVSVCF